MDLDNEIAKVAYELFERDGRQDGRDKEHWLEAERIVKARHAHLETPKVAKREPVQANKTAEKSLVTKKEALPKSPSGPAKPVKKTAKRTAK